MNKLCAIILFLLLIDIELYSQKTQNVSIEAGISSNYPAISSSNNQPQVNFGGKLMAFGKVNRVAFGIGASTNTNNYTYHTEITINGKQENVVRLFTSRLNAFHFQMNFVIIESETWELSFLIGLYTYKIKVKCKIYQHNSFII